MRCGGSACSSPNQRGKLCACDLGPHLNGLQNRDCSLKVHLLARRRAIEPIQIPLNATERCGTGASKQKALSILALRIAIEERNLVLTLTALELRPIRCMFPQVRAKRLEK